MKKELFFKRLLSLMMILCFNFTFAQDFDYTITDANMTVQVGADVCASVMEPGDLLGAFFTNAEGNLQNAGYLAYEGDQLAIAVWASESGLGNGFAAGEEIQWAMLSGGETVLLDSEMNSSPPFSATFVANGFGQVTSLSVAVAAECADDDSAVSAFGGCAGAVAALGCDFVFAGVPIGESCPVSCDSCPSDCADDDSAVSAFGGCAGAVAALGCDFVFGGVPIGDSCPASCDSCGGESEPVLGCTDSNAANYDATATEDDGSCIILGCTNPEAANYNTAATIDDGTCIILGCTDSAANNYNASATIDDSSCEYAPAEPGPMEYTITDANMTVQVSADVVFMNGDTPAPMGSLLGAYYTNDSGELVNAGYEVLDGDDQYAIAVWASESGLDNGFAAGEAITWVLQIGDDLFVAENVTMNSNPPFSATFVANGFGQILEAQFSGDFTADTPGCTDNTACNYDASATSDDGSCSFADAGLDCDGNCLADADGDGVCDDNEISGCSDSTACNYDSSATDDDGSCSFADAGYDCDGNCLTDTDGVGVCD
jgi:hypothetical protein